MTQAMTQETPGKVMALLGTALLSMAFLVGVAYSNASFQGTEIAMPSPFDPVKVVAAVDTAANSYSHFMYAYVINSVAQDYALAGDNLAWLSGNAKSGILAMVGIEEYQAPLVKGQPMVAGAYTYAVNEPSLEQPKTGGVIQALYSILIQ